MMAPPPTQTSFPTVTGLANSGPRSPSRKDGSTGWPGGYTCGTEIADPHIVRALHPCSVYNRKHGKAAVPLAGAARNRGGAFDFMLP